MSKQLDLALKIWPFVLALLLVLGVYHVERYAYPVVKDFQITHIEKSANQITMSGYLRKVRDCEYISVVARVDTDLSNIQVPITFLEDKERSRATTPTGSQPWGPWRITLPYLPEGNKLLFTSIHRCHAAWVTETLLSELPLTAFK